MDTPFYKAEVEAQRLPGAICDLIIGNTPGARAPEDPDPDWQESCAVMTRAQAKRKDNVSPLKLSIPDGLKFTEIIRDQLAELQRGDKSL